MTKRYSVPKNRYFVVCLVNEPWFYEREETPRQTKNRRIRATAHMAVALALAGGWR